MNKKVDFIGIGVQKSASTWVYRILQDHPEIRCSVPKELDFFSNKFEKGIDWYHSFFKKGEENKWGEISPSYFISDKAPLRASDYNLNIKIIVTLRDPVERAYSNHLHKIRTGDYSHKDNSFEKGLVLDKEYLNQSMYAKHLEKWFLVFPRNNILVLLQEDIQQNPKKAAKLLYKFLGVDIQHDSEFLKRKANVSYSVKSKGAKKGANFLFNLLRSVGVGFFVEKIRKTNVFLYLRDRNRTHLSETVPKMNDSTKHRLMEELSDDMYDLLELLNVKALPWETWRYLENKEKCKK